VVDPVSALLDLVCHNPVCRDRLDMLGRIVEAPEKAVVDVQEGFCHIRLEGISDRFLFHRDVVISEGQEIAEVDLFVRQVAMYPVSHILGMDLNDDNAAAHCLWLMFCLVGVRALSTFVEANRKETVPDHDLAAVNSQHDRVSIYREDDVLARPVSHSPDHSS
jgi:hypothetical protein